MVQAFSQTRRRGKLALFRNRRSSALLLALDWQPITQPERVPLQPALPALASEGAQRPRRRGTRP